MESEPGTMASEDSSQSQTAINEASSSFNRVTFSHPRPLRLGRNNFLLWREQFLAKFHGHLLQSFLSSSHNSPLKFLSAQDETNGVYNPEFLDWEEQDRLLSSSIRASMTFVTQGQYQSKFQGNVASDEFHQLRPLPPRPSPLASLGKVLQGQIKKKSSQHKRDFGKRKSLMCEAPETPNPERNPVGFYFLDSRHLLDEPDLWYYSDDPKVYKVDVNMITEALGVGENHFEFKSCAGGVLCYSWGSGEVDNPVLINPVLEQVLGVVPVLLPFARVWSSIAIGTVSDTIKLVHLCTFPLDGKFETMVQVLDVGIDAHWRQVQSFPRCNFHHEFPVNEGNFIYWGSVLKMSPHLLVFNILTEEFRIIGCPIMPELVDLCGCVGVVQGVSWLGGDDSEEEQPENEEEDSEEEQPGDEVEDSDEEQPGDEEDSEEEQPGDEEEDSEEEQPGDGIARADWYSSEDEEEDVERCKAEMGSDVEEIQSKGDGPEVTYIPIFKAEDHDESKIIDGWKSCGTAEFVGFGKLEDIIPVGGCYNSLLFQHQSSMRSFDMTTRQIKEFSFPPWAKENFEIKIFKSGQIALPNGQRLDGLLKEDQTHL